MILSWSNQFRGQSYSAEALAYFAAMSVQPSAARKVQIDTLINSLKTAGVWSKLDWISLVASHDAQAARLNAIDPTKSMTAVNSPTFTTDRGYTGNGSSSYLDTGWNTSTAGGKFAQNSCSMGVWCGTDVGSGSQYDIGHSNAAICSRGTGSTLITAQSASSSSITLGTSTSVGFTAFSRTSSTAGTAYKNGAALASAITSTSDALRNANFLVGATNSSSTGTVTPGTYSTRRIQAVCWGSQLSGTEQAALYNALNTYMTAIGA